MPVPVPVPVPVLLCICTVLVLYCIGVCVGFACVFYQVVQTASCAVPHFTVNAANVDTLAVVYFLSHY